MAYIGESQQQFGLPLIHAGARVYSAGYERGQASSSRDPTSHIYAPRPPPPTHHGQAFDQLQACREELARKDKLITELTSTEGIRSKSGEFLKYNDNAYPCNMTYPYYNTSPAQRRSSIGLQINTETYQNQIRELQAQLDARDTQLREMKVLIDASRETEAKHVAMIHSLRHTVARYEAQFGQVETVANRSGLALSTLQRENQEAQQRIVELEARLRTHLEERERAEQDRAVAERRLAEITSHFSSLLFLDVLNGGEAPTTEQIIDKTKELSSENATLKGQVAIMKDHVLNVDGELRASRDTIARLIGESERGQMSVSRYTLDMEAARLERDAAVNRQAELQRENDSLRERLDSTQRAWSTMRRDMDERRPCHDPAEVARNLECQGKAFKECLATLLSDGLCTVEPYEEHIRDRTHNLVIAIRDKNAMIQSLETQFLRVSSELNEQRELNRATERKNKRAEAGLADIEEKLEQRESRHTQDDKYIQLLEQLNRALGMSPFPVDLSLDGATDAVLTRAEELSRLERERSDVKSHVHSLQRKVKSLKEKLRAAENLLPRQEVAAEMREENKDKYKRTIEKYTTELEEAHNQIRELKSLLAEANASQAHLKMSEKEARKLEVKVRELEEIRQLQATRIAELQDTVKRLEGEGCRNERAGEELRIAQAALADITRRNRQLLELRQVMARMLGLNVLSATVADFEIVQRLEKLILANQSNLASTFILDTTVGDMVEGFRQGYEADPTRGEELRYPPLEEPTSHRRVTQSASAGHHRRSRSLSPNKKHDTRVY